MNLPPMPGVFPDYPARSCATPAAARDGHDALGMPPPHVLAAPVSIRNTSSPHWRGWLKPENRCLVPANGFAEYAGAEPRDKKERRRMVCAER